MAKDKNFIFDIDIKIAHAISAKNEEEARKIIKEAFFEDHAIYLEDEEIKLSTINGRAV